MEKTFSERVAEAKSEIPSVDAREADAMRGACEPVVFVDPRPADAASGTGRIPGAHHISLDDIERGQLPAALSDKWARVVTTCQGGAMAAIAAHELSKHGFRRVHYLEGGTQGWLDAGLPTQR